MPQKRTRKTRKLRRKTIRRKRGGAGESGTGPGPSPLPVPVNPVVAIKQKIREILEGDEEQKPNVKELLADRLFELGNKADTQWDLSDDELPSLGYELRNKVFEVLGDIRDYSTSPGVDASGFAGELFAWLDSEFP